MDTIEAKPLSPDAALVAHVSKHEKDLPASGQQALAKMRERLTTGFIEPEDRLWLKSVCENLHIPEPVPVPEKAPAKPVEHHIAPASAHPDAFDSRGFATTREHHAAIQDKKHK
jgi:hypothetical protein